MTCLWLSSCCEIDCVDDDDSEWRKNCSNPRCHNGTTEDGTNICLEDREVCLKNCENVLLKLDNRSSTYGKPTSSCTVL